MKNESLIFGTEYWPPDWMISSGCWPKSYTEEQADAAKADFIAAHRAYIKDHGYRKQDVKIVVQGNCVNLITRRRIIHAEIGERNQREDSLKREALQSETAKE